jgi:outer membrane lipoprotein carrier protein LolA
MIVSRRAVLAGSIVLGFVRIARADGDARDLVARIGRARASVRTVNGPFTQTRRIGLLATDVRSQGAFILARPDRMRWALAPPDEVTFWVGPEGLAYKSAHGQGRLSAATTRLGAVLQDLRALLGGDVATLGERWELRATRDDASGAEIEATPRATAGMHLQRLTLTLDADLVRPTRALIVEGPRDRTVIDFGPLAVNGPVDEALLRMP